MPGLSLGDHAIPILLILKMSVLRKAIFFATEAGFRFAHIEQCKIDVAHDCFPFCKSSFCLSGGTIAQFFGFVIKLVVKFSKKKQAAL